jgi:hypothetical protein
MIINNHGHDSGTERKKAKTYRRFFGTIFFGGVGSAVMLERQSLAMKEIPKTWKNTKKRVK